MLITGGVVCHEGLYRLSGWLHYPKVRLILNLGNFSWEICRTSIRSYNSYNYTTDNTQETLEQVPNKQRNQLRWWHLIVKGHFCCWSSGRPHAAKAIFDIVDSSQAGFSCGFMKKIWCSSICEECSFRCSVQPHSHMGLQIRCILTHAYREIWRGNLYQDKTNVNVEYNYLYSEGHLSAETLSTV